MNESGADAQGDAPGHDEPGSTQASLAVLLHDRGYLTLLLMAALLGAPLSLVAFFFLASVHELEHLVWETWPHELGFDELPVWWPVLTIGLAGAVVALAVTRLPGHGGHVPADGLGGGPTPPSAVPGVVLAAGASLVGGAVVGPEAPLIVIGGGLALLAIRRTPAGGNPTASSVIAAAGSAAAISTIFGNPLVAVVMFLEILGLGRRQLMLVVLPCLLSCGVGSIVFTGLGRWTGFEIGALALPDLEPQRLAVSDVAWAIPLASVVAAGIWLVFLVAGRVTGPAATRVWTTTIGAGLLTGLSAAAYALVTDHSPAEVALSGQATLPVLAGEPDAWSTGALVALLGFKAVAYAACLGTFRGGRPAFPALFLGAGAGVLASSVVPGISLVPALAIGMAAGVAIIGLPVTSVALVVLLLGEAATSQMPVVIIAVVAALVVQELLSTRADHPAPAAEEVHPTGVTP